MLKNFELNLLIITARYTNFGFPKLTSFLVLGQSSIITGGATVGVALL